MCFNKGDTYMANKYIKRHSTYDLLGFNAN